MAATVIDLSAIQPDSLYPPTIAGVFLSKTEKTLANMRCTGRGPAWHRIGNKPFYRGRDLLSHIESSRVGGGSNQVSGARRERAAA